MPYVIRWPHKRAMALAASCCALLVTAAPAAASLYPVSFNSAGATSASTAACPVPASSPVFSVLGDTADYFPLPDGSFTNGGAGWTLNGGASVVPGGEPWNVSGSTNPQSLNIPPGGSAISPPICVTSLFPSWRFFAQSNGSSSLQASILWTAPGGMSGTLPEPGLSDSNYSSWAATPSLALGSLLMPGVVMTNRFEFTVPANANGSWTIDDAYVDPYAR
jgi:hypothetical protein